MPSWARGRLRADPITAVAKDAKWDAGPAELGFDAPVDACVVEVRSAAGEPRGAITTKLAGPVECRPQSTLRDGTG
jgi:hypothetical protein